MTLNLKDSNCNLICLIISLLLIVIFYNILNLFLFPGKIIKDELIKGTSSSSSSNSNNILKVYLFQGSGKTISSSPFSIKLSSYLRLNNIPHNVYEADIMKAPKGKVPYIIHNNNIISDSELIIRYLENTFNLKIMANYASKKYNIESFVSYSDLSSNDKALCEMIRLVCEGQLYWGLVSVRWLGFAGVSGLESNWHNTVKNYFDKIPSFIRPLLTSMIRVDIYNASKAFGLSRHSKNDQCYLIFRAIDSLSTVLGTKPFFLGNFPTECDCIAFGTLQGLCDDDFWPNPITDYIKQNCKNLFEYNQRVKKLLYNDFKDGERLPKGVEVDNAQIVFKEEEEEDKKIK